MTAATRTVLAPDEATTTGLAARLAPLLQGGDVVTLAGPLGAGKSTLARAILRSLGEAGEVPSPTFTLVQSYEPEGAPAPVHHFDCYRLDGPDDALELGLEDAIATDICLIEWADRIAPLLPQARLDIALAPTDGPEDARTITLTGHGAWAARLDDCLDDCLKGMQP